MNLKGKIILVTGGANGIGKALCERFSKEGAAKIFVADLDFENAVRVAESVGGKAFRLDVADEANCRSVVADARGRSVAKKGERPAAGTLPILNFPASR